MAGRPLRFCMVTTFYPPYHFGGDAVFLQRLVGALLRRGHQVDVVHDVDAFAMLHQGAMPNAAASQDAEQHDGLTIHRLRSRWGSLGCLATHQAGRPTVHASFLRRLLDNGRFDVIHFHNVSLIGGPGILEYGASLKLYTAHEHWLVCPTHVLWRHNRELCDAKQCLRCTLHHRRPPQLWRGAGLIDRCAPFVDAFLSPSQFSADKHREFGFLFPMHVMPYFLPDDPEPTGPRDDTVATGRPYFLFVGRLEKIKGLQDVLPHFAGDGPCDLVVAGTGAYESELRQQAQAMPRVRFVGRKDSAELRPLVRGARAVIVPSVCYETFGIVILEAFRERRPVIARSLGPMTEIVEESGGGLLFETQAQLGGALQRLASDRALADRLGEAGWQALQRNWTESAVLPQYFELIAQCAASKGNVELFESLQACGDFAEWPSGEPAPCV